MHQTTAIAVTPLPVSRGRSSSSPRAASTTTPPAHAALRLAILRDVLLHVCDGDWAEAERALAREVELPQRDPACINLRGVIAQARGHWRRARRLYGKAMRIDRNYLPAEQNLRRVYELDTFGSTKLPIALIDRVTLTAIRNLLEDAQAQPQAQSPQAQPQQQQQHRLDQLDALKSISPAAAAQATMLVVKRRWDWRGFAWATVAVALATAVGWPLVHSPLRLGNANALMLYFLAVILVATQCRRGAAVLASLLSVATFDFVFVEPYYTFAVADEQYLVTFAVMLVTALVISTLTDRMRKQSDLAHEAWERVETEFLRNTLLSGVSHDLRTPLAAITGASSTLIHANGNIDSATRDDLLKTISSESERMERLINSLLDMTRLESGGLLLNLEWQPLQEVIGSALNHVDARLRGREVKIHLPNDLPLIQIDGVAVEHVLINLLENACAYSPASTPIEISARVAADELIVEVADRGPGLPAGAEQRIFEKFVRLHSADSRHGIGLGLAIARGIIEAHGGQIAATNRPGGGAAFRFTIPLTVTPPTLDTTA